MLNSGNRINLYTIITTFIVLCLASFMFAFRKRLFHEKNRNKKTALQEGYGYYDEPITMGCITEGDLCDTPGTQTSVQKCIPHPVTGNGCFDETSGTMTFKAKTTSKSCTKPCVRNVMNVTKSEDYETEATATGNPAKDNTTKKLFYKGVNNVIEFR